MESVVDTVSTGLDSPVEVILDDGDIGPSAGSAAFGGDGGDDKLDIGGVNRPELSSPSRRARRSPVERLKVKGRDRSGEESLLVPEVRAAGDCARAATGVASPSVFVVPPASSTCSIAFANESHDSL